MAAVPTSIGTAGSKVILLGEHAVVHGTDALVVGMPNGVSARVTPAITAGLTLTPWQLDESAVALLSQALTDLCIRLGVSDPLHFSIDASIPARAGLGASASVGLACARGVNQLFGLHLSDDLLFQAVLAFEHVFHQKSSGVDIRAVAQPGCALFHPGGEMISVESPNVPLMVVHSGEAGDTGMTVRRFDERVKRDEAAAAKVSRLGALVFSGVKALEQAAWNELGALMNEAHCLLKWFGVSTANLDRICDIALQNGALGAKLTGGGGGGCAVILVMPTEHAQVANALGNAGYKVVF